MVFGLITSDTYKRRVEIEGVVIALSAGAYISTTLYLMEEAV
jgi:hypothetical protein